MSTLIPLLLTCFNNILHIIFSNSFQILYLKYTNRNYYKKRWTI